MNPDIQKYVPIKSSNLLVPNAPRTSVGAGKTQSPDRIPAGNSNSHGREQKANRIFKLVLALKALNKNSND